MNHRTLMLAAVVAASAGLGAPALAQQTKVEPGQAINPVDLPRPREIINRHIEAVGGEATIRSKTSRHTKGIITYPNAPEPGTIEVYAAAPDKTLFIVTIPSLGMNMVGHTSDVAWSISKQFGPQILSGKLADQVREQATFYSALYPDSLYKSMETVEKTTFEDRPAWRVKLETASGSIVHHIFDVESGLLIGTQEEREIPGQAPVSVVNIVSNYKDFDGLKIATKNTQRIFGGETVTEIASVEFNNVSPEVFDLPREIEVQRPTPRPRPAAPGNQQPSTPQ